MSDSLTTAALDEIEQGFALADKHGSIYQPLEWPALIAAARAGIAALGLVETGGSLTFAALRAANRARLPQFKNRRGELAHSEPDGSDWKLSAWCNAVLGELGEAANMIKKIERKDITLDEARPELAKEFADVVTYLDILSFRAGVELGQATIDKFNEVSARVGSTITLRAATSAPAEAESTTEEYVTRHDNPEPPLADWQPTDEMVRECLAQVEFALDALSMGHPTIEQQRERFAHVDMQRSRGCVWSRAALHYAATLFGAEAERLRDRVDFLEGLNEGQKESVTHLCEVLGRVRTTLGARSSEDNGENVEQAAVRVVAEAIDARTQLSACPTAPLLAVPMDLLARLPQTALIAHVVGPRPWTNDECNAIDDLLALLRATPQSQAIPMETFEQCGQCSTPNRCKRERNCAVDVDKLTDVAYAHFDPHKPEHLRSTLERVVRAVLAAIPQPPPVTTTLIQGIFSMTDEEIKYLVNRFLGWKLPEDFNPDGGLTFKPVGNEGTDAEYKHKPSGTNLLDAQQATAMVRYMIDGLSFVPATADPEAVEIAGRLPDIAQIYRWTEPGRGGALDGYMDGRLAMMRAAAYVRKAAAGAPATTPLPPAPGELAALRADVVAMIDEMADVFDAENSKPIAPLLRAIAARLGGGEPV